MKHLEKYVGRVVSLNRRVFLDVAKRAQRHEQGFDNCFLVASVNWKMQQLVCYGASCKVLVEPTEVALI